MILFINCVSRWTRKGKKNKFTLISYSKLKEKYENLKKQLETKSEISMVENTVSSETKKNKSWFFG